VSGELRLVLWFLLCQVNCELCLGLWFWQLVHVADKFITVHRAAMFQSNLVDGFQ